MSSPLNASRHELLGYVFIRSGAITTDQPHLYPDRKAQITSLLTASGFTLSTLHIEKVRVVTELTSLPVLCVLIRHAFENKDQVVMDDFRRLFVACPRQDRMNFLKKFFACRELLWELRNGGRSLSSYNESDLQGLIEAPNRLDASFNQAPRKTKSSGTRRLQTSNARVVSANARAQLADKHALAVQDLATRMTTAEGKPTLEAIAEEATRLGLKTTRGNPWTPPSISRALRRVSQVPDSRENLER